MKSPIPILLTIAALCALGAASMTACTLDPPPDEDDGDDDDADGDDDDADDDADDDGDDDLDDDGGDDDVDDDADDDADDDSDDDTGPFADDRLLYVPAIVEPGGAAVVVMTEAWSDDDGSWFRVALVSPTTAQIVRQGPAIGTGTYGYGSAWVEDFDGDGVAEIVAALLDADADTTGTRLVLIDPATLDIGTVFDLYVEEFATLGPMIDQDGDDVPELAVRLRSNTTGRARTTIYDFRPAPVQVADSLGLAGPTLSHHTEFRGLPRRGAWQIGYTYPWITLGAELPVLIWGETDDATPFVSATTTIYFGSTSPGPAALTLRESGAFSAYFGPLDSDNEHSVLLGLEEPDRTSVALYDQHVSIGDEPARVLATYAPDTSVRISASNDLDLDGLRDPAIFAVPPDGSARLDVRLSNGNWTGGPSYSGDFDNIRLLGARTPPGILKPGPIGGYDHAFGVLFDVTGSGGSSRIFWYAAPDFAGAGRTEFLQVDADNHLATDARVHDFDGDGDDELVVATIGYDEDSLARRHRLRVYDEDLEDPSYDTGDVDGLATLGSAWDWNDDGAAEIPMTIAGDADDPTVMRLYDNTDGWMSPIFEYSAEPGAIVTLLGLFR